MKRVIGLIFGLTLILSAQTLHYKVYSPVIGKLGKVTLTIQESGNSYKIVGEGKTYGMAKMLTNKRRDKYTSQGVIKNGKYITHRFVMDKKNSKKRELIEYKFDYKNKTVLKHKQGWKHGKKYKDFSKKLKYFSDVDLAALFHNIVLEMKSSGRKEYLAVGAEKIKGRVMAEVPTPDVARRERKILGVSSDMKIVHIGSREKIEGKRNRKAIFAVDNNGVIHKGYFDAIPVVGKIYVELRK